MFLLLGAIFTITPAFVQPYGSTPITATTAESPFGPVFYLKASELPQNFTTSSYLFPTPHNTMETFEILRSGSDYFIEVQLLTFETERNFDFLMVKDGSQPLGKLSGSHSSVTVIGTSDALTLEYNTDFSVSSQGFITVYREFLSTCEISNLTAAAMNQTINFSPMNGSNEDCLWIIKKPVGNSHSGILLSIARGIFTNAKLEIYEFGPSASLLPIVSFSGEEITDSVFFLQNNYRIRYRQMSEGDTQNGFNASFRLFELSKLNRDRNFTATKEANTLSSPFYPSYSPSGLMITYYITPAQNNTFVEVVINRVDFGFCCSNLQVYDGQVWLGSLNRDHSNVEIIAIDQVVLRYATYGSEFNGGFTATYREYTLTCTENVRRIVSDQLQSIEISSQESSEDCFWLIQQASGNRNYTRLRIDEISFTNASLEIYQAGSNSLPYLMITQDSRYYSIRLFTSTNFRIRYRAYAGYNNSFNIDFVQYVAEDIQDTVSLLTTEELTILESPFYPFSPPNNVRLIYNITLSNPNYIIEFHVLEFETKRCCDGIIAYSDDEEIGSFRGSSEDFYLFSEHQLTIEYRTHFNVFGKGFSGTLREFLPNCGSRNLLASLQNQSLYWSSDGDSDYCLWTIRRSFDSQEDIILVLINANLYNANLQIYEIGSGTSLIPSINITNQTINFPQSVVGSGIRILYRSFTNQTSSFAAFYYQQGSVVSPCLSDVPINSCLSDPCLNATCPGIPNAVCNPSFFCGRCSANFTDIYGNPLSDEECRSTENKTIPEMQCPADTTCNARTVWICKYVKWRIAFYIEWRQTFQQWENENSSVRRPSSLSFFQFCPILYVYCRNLGQLRHIFGANGCVLFYCADGYYQDIPDATMLQWRRDQSMWRNAYQGWQQALLANEVDDYQF